jgi:serine/threonine protein kinase
MVSPELVPGTWRSRIEYGVPGTWGVYDAKPVPKVIDFGVAKAAGPKLNEATLFTGFGRVVGTPEYAAPERR